MQSTSTWVSVDLRRIEPHVRQGPGPVLEPRPPRTEQDAIIAEDGIAIKRQSECMALENGLSDPLLAPTALLPLFLGNRPLSYVMCGFQAGGDKGRRPRTEFPDRCRFEGMRAYRRATQRLTAQDSQQNCLDDFGLIPLWITADRLGIDSRGNQGVAPGAEGVRHEREETASGRSRSISY